MPCLGDEVSKAFASQGIMVHTLMLVFGKQRGSCISEFEANLVHKASPKTAKATQRNQPSLRENENKNKPTTHGYISQLIVCSQHLLWKETMFQNGEW